MKKSSKLFFITYILLFILFLGFTFAVKTIDVKAIGPNDSVVGFAFFNQSVKDFFGTNMFLYYLTDWLSIIAIVNMFSFAVVGFIQLIKRKNLFNVDYNFLLLGVFYIIIFGIYALFEAVVINYRPILIEGYLEASYPSSTTMLILCVMPTTIMQINRLIKNKKASIPLNIIIIIFTIFMVVCRMISGVHWLSDIVGGTILSGALVTLYYAFLRLTENYIAKKSNA